MGKGLVVLVRERQFVLRDAVFLSQCTQFVVQCAARFRGSNAFLVPYLEAFLMPLCIAYRKAFGAYIVLWEFLDRYAVLFGLGAQIGVQPRFSLYSILVLHP